MKINYTTDVSQSLRVNPEYFGDYITFLYENKKMKEDLEKAKDLLGSLSGLISCGWGNGYVGVKRGHPLYGKHYTDVNVQVHGGLTFSDQETINGEDYWIFGFDTVHHRDNEVNWSEDHVQKETYNLLKELKKIK